MKEDQRSEVRGQRSEEGKESSSLPMGWEVVRLGNVCSFEYGKALRNDLRRQKGEFPVMGSNGCVGFHDKFLVNGPGVVIGRKGAAGQVSFVSNKFWPIDTTYFLKLNSDSSLLYFYYLLKSIRLNRFEKSTAIPGLNRTDAYDQIVIVPPVPEQYRIVAKIEELFSSLDKGIENLKASRQQLKVYRQVVLKWAFEGKLTNENVVDGELPSWWTEKKVSEIADTFGGFAFKSGAFKQKGKYQVLRMGNIRPGILRYDENAVFLEDVEETVLNKALLKKNDVVISQTGTKAKRDYGFTALIPKTNLLLNQRIAAIRCNEKCLPKFFLYYTWTDRFKNQYFANETGNVGQGNVGMKAVTDTLVYLPTLEEQHAIVAEIESRLSVCDKIEKTIEQSLRQAESLRQSILKKAFEGKLVPQDPNDEPASELLARIRAENALRDACPGNSQKAQRSRKDTLVAKKATVVPNKKYKKNRV